MHVFSCLSTHARLLIVHHKTGSKSIPQHEQSVSCLNNNNEIENMNVADIIKYTYIDPAKQVIRKQSLTGWGCLRVFQKPCHKVVSSQLGLSFDGNCDG